MGIKIVKDDNKVPQLLEVINQIENYHIEVGILADEGFSYVDDSGNTTPLLVIARVHEFGADIKFSGGGSIAIPERSFIRGSFDKYQKDFQEKGRKLLDMAIHFEMSVYAAYDALGEYAVGKTQEFLTELDSPKNSPATIGMKGSSNPLIDTGRLRQSITHRVVT